MLAAKLKILKNLQKQMHCLMAEGHGDDEGAGKDALEQVAEGGDEGDDLEEKLAEAKEEATDGERDELVDAKRSFFKRSGKLDPKKSAMVVMKVAAKPAFGGKPEKLSKKHG